MRNTIISLCEDVSSDNIMQSFYDSLKVFYYAKFTSTLSLVHYNENITLLQKKNHFAKIDMVNRLSLMFNEIVV